MNKHTSISRSKFAQPGSPDPGQKRGFGNPLGAIVGPPGVSRTLGIGGLIALLALAWVALLFLAWPNALAAADTPTNPGDPALSPDAPLPDVPIVFVSRNRLETLDNIHVGPPVDVPGRERTPGGRLLVWRPDGSATDLTAGTSLYDVQQPDVSFNGTKVVFSAVEERGTQWHLYEIGLDCTGLRQLTFDDRDIPIPDDPGNPGRNERVFGRYGDFGPAYLPDGRIIFVPVAPGRDLSFIRTCALLRWRVAGQRRAPGRRRWSLLLGNP